MEIFSAILGNAGAVSPEELVKQYGRLLTENEEIELGFKLLRDTFIFTNKRLILVDIQGITGSKTEYKSITYKSISSSNSLLTCIVSKIRTITSIRHISSHISKEYT